MEIYELRSFLTLAEQLHFGRAAQSLNLSQPALTKQIRKVEDELGAPLFERGTHGTRLTALGAQWLPRVRELVTQFNRLVEDGKSGAVGQIGRLRIGFGFHSLEVVPHVVVALRKQSPKLEISLRDMSTREQAAALQEEQIDVGFLRMPTRLGAEFTELPVLQDRLVLVSASQPSSGHTLTLENCRDAPFVMISPRRSPGFFGHAVRLCAAHGFHPRVVQEVTEFTTALALTRAGMGVTLIPESFWKNKFAGSQCYPIDDPDAVWSVSAVWRRKDTNPVLATFLQQLKQMVQK